ncbi:M1 family metallopeptidase [Xanthomonas vesicatoria]|nr:M1 family metallopeptidase [Xanthomonas vesicatoria]KTF34405.1 peptidase M1 [Xanthomonas vesicatoria]MCC8595145.1 M1 family metallopeptidase [Xanthomonas vesicatoria]MCC8603434.1 M1 family metallopeptidase [Xanthomonas vesicatoria]MCC8616653.1 M1 family metallopeptidase [Xanthomonas vesicatoria]MCC8630321.1 M1 family metallopeptidase [Xanthomonas vesicatoria]
MFPTMRRSFAVALSLACISAPALAATAAQAAAPPGGFDPLVLFAPLQLPDAPDAYRSGGGVPGPLFWQNRADYQLHASIDPASHTLSGEAAIHYTNHSPDTLDVLWLQLDQNMYRADARAAASRPSRRTQFTDGMQIASVEVERDGHRQPVHFVVDDTRMRVDLPQPLAGQGKAMTLHIRYRYRIPGTWGGRTAYSASKQGEIYEIAQWYPRMAVYDDLRGWDTQPYLGSEFYLEYGDFDYAVTVPEGFLVAGSGALTNPAEVLSRAEQQRLQQARDSDRTVLIRTPADVAARAAAPAGTGTRTWRFHMEHTRDVAFAASPAFVWDAARINLPGGKQSLAMSVYPVEGVGADKWNRSTEYVKGAIEHFSQWYPYPWPAAINLGGYGAGMEYPGIVFDGFEDGGKDLFWITAHEIGHTWFPMIVGSNERRHAFMDEGFNTFIDVYASDAFNKGEYAPKRDSEYAPKGGNPVDEILPLLADVKAPTLMDIADATSETYRHPLTYFKGALGLVLLREQILGPERFDPAFRKYIATWAYKHPTPSDFFRLMESESGEDLSWWWRGWYFNNWQLDMGIARAQYVDHDPAKGLQLTLRSRQKLVMPVTVRVDLADGSHLDRRVPVESWLQNTAPTLTLPTTQKVLHVTLDPDHALPDADRSDDRVDVIG